MLETTDSTEPSSTMLLLFNLKIKTAPKSLKGGYIQDNRMISRPRKEKEGWPESSSRCSEWHMIENLDVAYCLNFPFNIFRLLD